MCYKVDLHFYAQLTHLIFSLGRCCLVCILSVSISFSWQEMNSGVSERSQILETSAALQVEINRRSWWDVEGVLPTACEMHAKQHWGSTESKWRLLLLLRFVRDTKFLQSKARGLNMHSNISQFYARLNYMTVQKFGVIKILKCFWKEVCHTHQGYIYLITNTLIMKYYYNF